MQKLVRLRQQQQSTDNHLQSMVQHLQGMEHRQQQMMSFLAKAVQSPGFLSHLVQRQTETNKNRRLKQERVSGRETSPTPDGQIVKYVPLVNKNAHPMLRQLRKLDSNFNRNPDNFCIGDSSSNRVTGVTLQEVPACVTPAIVSSDTVSLSKFPEISGLVSSSEATPSISIPQTDAVMIPELSPIPDIAERSLDIARANYMVTDTGDDDFIDLASVGPIDIEKLSTDPDIDRLLDDSTWEQFFDRDFIPGDGDEIEVPSVECLAKEKE